MNFRERMNAVLHHQQPDRVPWAPRAGFMPRGAFVRSLLNQGMGLNVYKEARWGEAPNVVTETRVKDGIETRVYKTPCGSVSDQWKTHVGRISNNERVQTQWKIKDVADYETVIFMCDDEVLHADYSVYHNLVRELGTDGIVGDVAPGAPYDTFVPCFGRENWTYEQVDHPREFARLLEAQERRAERAFPLVLDSPADLVYFGHVNSWTTPKKFAEYTVPYYKKWVPQLQKKGKMCSIHACAGNLASLKDLIPELGLDIIEAFTPPPVGSLSVRDARAAWGDDVILWVNFPEVIFHQGRDATKRYLMQILEENGATHNLVISTTEMGFSCIQDDEMQRMYETGFATLAEVLGEHT